MKRFVCALLISLMLATAPAFPISQKKLKEIEHRSMHEIVMLERDERGETIGGGLCTAYAIGPHTLLTAQHCNANTSRVYIDPVSRDAVKKDQAKSYKIVSREFDNEDHMLLDVEGTDFKDTIYLGPNVRTPVQGESVYFWGNPSGVKDQYREGLVSGSIKYDGDGDVNAKVGSTLYIEQMPAVGGDSGSAIFSAKDGALVGIVTFGIAGGKFTGSFPIQFTGEQIANSLK